MEVLGLLYQCSVGIHYISKLQFKIKGWLSYFSESELMLSLIEMTFIKIEVKWGKYIEVRIFIGKSETFSDKCSLYLIKNNTIQNQHLFLLMVLILFKAKTMKSYNTEFVSLDTLGKIFMHSKGWLNAWDMPAYIFGTR